MRALLSDPGGSARQAIHDASDDAFSLLYGLGSHVQASRGSMTRLAIVAVYASQAGSPLHHARLAFGWVPTFAGRGSTRRTPVEISAHASFSSRLRLAQAGWPRGV